MSKDGKEATRGFSFAHPYFWRGPDVEEEPPGHPNEIKPLPPIIHALHINLPGLRICDRNLKTKVIDREALPELRTFQRPTLKDAPPDQKEVLEALGASFGTSEPPKDPTTPPRRSLPAREARCSTEPFVPAPANLRSWKDSLMIYERVVWIRPEVPSTLELPDARRIPTPPAKPLETPRFPWFQSMRDGLRNMVADWFQVLGSQEEGVPEYQEQESQTIDIPSHSPRRLPPKPQGAPYSQNLESSEFPVALPEEKRKKKLPWRPDGTLFGPRSSSGERKLPDTPNAPPYEGPWDLELLYQHLKQEPLRPEDEGRFLQEDFDSLRKESTPTPQGFQVPGPSRPQHPGLPERHPGTSGQYLGPSEVSEGHVDPRLNPGPPRQQIPLVLLLPVVIRTTAPRESLHQNQWRNIRHEAPQQRRQLPNIQQSPNPPQLSGYSVDRSETSSEYSESPPTEYIPTPNYYPPESPYLEYYSPTPSSGRRYYEDPGPRWTPSPGYSDYHHPRHYRSSSVGYDNYGRGRGTPESQQLPSEYESSAPSYYRNESSLSARSPVPIPQGFRRGFLQRQENVDVPTTSSDLSAPASEVGRDSQGRYPRDSATPRSPDYWPGRRY